MRKIHKILCLSLTVLMTISYICSCNSNESGTESITTDSLIMSESETNEINSEVNDTNSEVTETTPETYETTFEIYETTSETCETNESNETIPPEENENPFANLNYLAFGDSITEGGNLESRSQSYPNVVANILGCNVTNVAVGGSTFVRDPDKSIRHCIAEDVINFCNNTSNNFDIISIAGGVNDQSLAFPIGDIDDNTTETIYGSLNIIVQTLMERYPDAFIFLVTPLKYYTNERVDSETDNRAGYNLSDVSDVIKAIGDKYDLPVLDLYSTSGFETATNGMHHPDCDGWHPIKEFVTDHLAPQVSDFIRENYKK